MNIKNKYGTVKQARGETPVMKFSLASGEQQIYSKLHCNFDTEAVCICSGPQASVAHFKVLFMQKKRA